MKIHCSLIIIIALLCQSHRKAQFSKQNETFYLTQETGVPSSTYLIIRHNPNIYERYYRHDPQNTELGTWIQKKDTLYLIPRYEIKQGEIKNTITKLENYFTIRTIDDLLKINWLLINSYIIRENGLYEEREISTPYLPECFLSPIKADPLDPIPKYYKIPPKNNRLKKIKRIRCLSCDMDIDSPSIRFFSTKQQDGEPYKTITIKYGSHGDKSRDHYILFNSSDSAVTAGVCTIANEKIFLEPRIRYYTNNDTIVVQNHLSTDSSLLPEADTLHVINNKMINKTTLETFFKIKLFTPYPNVFFYHHTYRPLIQNRFFKKIEREFEKDQRRKNKARQESNRQ